MTTPDRPTLDYAGLWLGAIGLLLFIIEYVRGWRSRDE
jgi:hypothetical protein